MKQARDPFPQLGNNLWTGSPPAEAKVLARFAGPGPAIPRAALQHGRHLGCSRALSPSRGGAGSGPGGQAARRKQGARPRWVRKRARERPTGRASARKRRPLQQAPPRAHDRRCPSSTDRDNGQSSTQPSRVVVMPGRLSGESRSGPEPWKLGRGDRRKDGHAAGDDVRRGLNLAGQPTSTRFKSIWGCARGSN